MYLPSLLIIITIYTLETYNMWGLQELTEFVFNFRVAENCKLNSMDSKNLAICFWPTLLHTLQFTDFGEFESQRPHIEDIIQTMIDQFPFLFQGKEDYVMVWY